MSPIVIAAASCLLYIYILEERGARLCPLKPLIGGVEQTQKFLASGGLRIIRPLGPPLPLTLSILDTAVAAAAAKSIYNIVKRYWYLRGTRLRDLRPVNTIVKLFMRG